MSQRTLWAITLLATTVLTALAGLVAQALATGTGPLT